MRSQNVLFAAAAVLAADVVVLLTGAAGDDKATTVAADIPPTTVPAATAEPTLDPNATTTTPATPTSEAAPATTAPETTTTLASAGGPVARSMPLPGVYTQAVSGSANGQPVPPSASFRIEQVNDTDQRHVADSPQGPTTQVLRFTPNEVLLVSIDLAGMKQFEPNPPARLAPVGPAVGESWSWQVTSTDGQTHLAQTSTVARAEQLTIAGEAVDTHVIETTLSLTGDLTGTIRLTSWASPVHAMVVRTHQVSDITFQVLITFTSDTTAELTSLVPA